jgi:hypothetical protein
MTGREGVQLLLGSSEEEDTGKCAGEAGVVG